METIGVVHDAFFVAHGGDKVAVGGEKDLTHIGRGVLLDFLLHCEGVEVPDFEGAALAGEESFLVG